MATDNVIDNVAVNTRKRDEELVDLGQWLGRRQAFGLLASRCTAADAECLKQMRDQQGYKKLGYNWNDFCEQKAGISRRYADKLIGHLEEFGVNYFRLAELTQMSSETYRLIAGAVSDEGIEHQGEKIALTPENRKRLVQAVEALKPAAPVRSEGERIQVRLKTVLDQVSELKPGTYNRLLLLSMLDEVANKLRNAKATKPA
jgi:hypothetical protein